MDAGSTAAHAGFRSRRASQAFNEAAFRHFLAVDRSRARRSHRSLYLVLVAIRASVGRRARLSNATAAAIFRGLARAVREVDFVGWYHEHYVAAAALAPGVKAGADVKRLILHRTIPAVRKELSAAQSRNLRVCVVRLGNQSSG